AMRSETQRSFWQEKLSDIQPTILPRLQKTKRLRNQRPEILERLVPISHELSEGLKRFATTAKLPLKSVVLAAPLRVLSLLTGQDEVVTGLVSNGRPEVPDGDRTAGLFLNTQPLRLRLPGGTWEDLVRATFEAEREIIPFRRFPFLEIQRMADTPLLFETGFNYTHFHIAHGMLELPGFKILEFRGISETNFPLLVDFDLDLTVSEVQLALKYEAGEFTREQIEVMSGYYERTLLAIATKPGAQYEECSLLSEKELRWQIEDLNDRRRSFPQTRGIHQLSAEQVTAKPEADAVEFGKQELTKAE